MKGETTRSTRANFSSWFRDFTSNNTIAILGQKSTYFLHIFPPNVAASQSEDIFWN